MFQILAWVSTSFNSGLDSVFSTCGVDGIRVWSDVEKNGGSQALHIPGPSHAQALCIIFTKDGKSILSGWSDGCVRCFTPQTGKLIYMIQVCTIVLSNQTLVFSNASISTFVISREYTLKVLMPLLNWKTDCSRVVKLDNLGPGEPVDSIPMPNRLCFQRSRNTVEILFRSD